MTSTIEPNAIIDGTYRVESVCSESGGMGTLLRVSPVGRQEPFPLVLKYCRDENEESLARFKREVRLLQEFQGNSRVVETVDANLDHVPPYFVMRYYRDGDLTTLHDALIGDYEFQERIFTQMIECVGELHRPKKVPSRYQASKLP